MFSNYGTLASIFLKRGLATSKSLALSTHCNINYFRPAINEIRRNYSAVKSSDDDKTKINERALSNEILEILDSPDKLPRDHKYYRSATLIVENFILS